ncbi:MAG TPA: FAD-binding protein [Polyangiaceae bacterium]
MSTGPRGPRLLHDVEAALPGLRASADEADRVFYARDLWPRHLFAVRAGHPAEHRPGLIVWPSSTDDVARLVRWAANSGTPVVPFGAGSGVCGGVLPREDVVVVDLKRMARVRTIDPEAPTVDVEAGQMGVPFERSLGRAGFTLGHFPSSILCSTVGGWVATRSAGQCSGAYGKIEDMVVALECVTGRGDVVTLRRRTSEQDLVPLVVGSEGTLAVVTSAKLRLHPAPAARGFGAWSLPSTEAGWEAMRALYQGGLRPAVARLYDPLDAAIAKRSRPAGRARRGRPSAPGIGDAVLRSLLRRPAPLNDLLHSAVAARALGGAMLLVVFDSSSEREARDAVDHARRLLDRPRTTWLGEDPSRAWLARRYAVSYRQAPLFARGAFVDTMEVAAPWSKLGALYDGVRRALGANVLVMAHFGHAYPDGCCVYFTFAGVGDPAIAGVAGWDAACEATYDRAWKAALLAAAESGGTIAHHHGVGRSKAPRLERELGSAVDVVRDVMRAFDPSRILNPGNLVPEEAPGAGARSEAASAAPPPANGSAVLAVDAESLLAHLDGRGRLRAAEEALNGHGLTLDVGEPPENLDVADWLAMGAPGARDRWLDPVDQLLAGYEATLLDGRRIALAPAPRRSVGPDLGALFVGARGRYGRIDRAFVRVHRKGYERPSAPAFVQERDPPPTDDERAIGDAIAAALRAR